MGGMTAAFSTSFDQSDDAALARELVKHAGTLALRMRDEGLETTEKTSVSDVVTDADRAAENFVAEALGKLRPADGILGEEGAAKASTSGRTWVVDPVDGTYNFASGSDYFCSAIALVEGEPANPERILTSAVYRPALETLWQAADGQATCNGRRLGPLPAAGLDQLGVATYLHPASMQIEPVRAAWTAAVEGAATIRMLGAGSIDLSTVASGGIGAWLQHTVADWDWLPGRALVEAAGGRTIKVSAGGVEWCVAGNQRVIEDIATRLSHHA
ncbi:inositol monophosphatase family protein [Corynebacterium liangguodongii]|uniref:Inositol monophosphatase n=1 Tax=Corynebacterium liangguodongii TaxID=2079535 RepID=A0A2S0WCV3_9CORY|nr:inositol monophosphatase family protein [Corynebacterium liangguodongii]AWB83593.1 inositol monophosphatase [Corynebacterium liangguodongii]PWB98615.1 inositol monophosphatase family protein [Corynebacterium liangguodongii]